MGCFSLPRHLFCFVYSNVVSCSNVACRACLCGAFREDAQRFSLARVLIANALESASTIFCFPVLLLLFSVLCLVQVVHVWLASIAVVDMVGSMRAPSSDEAHKELTFPPLMPGTVASSWQAALGYLRSSRTRYVIINAKNGLGNRIRALASAMSVAEYVRRPVLLIWVRDLHLNCSFSKMFDQPLPFAILEEEIPLENLTMAEFQVRGMGRTVGIPSCRRIGDVVLASRALLRSRPRRGVSLRPIPPPCLRRTGVQLYEARARRAEGRVRGRRPRPAPLFPICLRHEPRHGRVAKCVGCVG